MLDQGGLSRTGMPDNAQDFALLHPKVNVVKRGALKRGACSVDMSQAPCF